MDEYTLYLDESSDKSQKLFSISGLIVNNSNIDILNTGILDMKKYIWDESYIEKNNPILHCVELTRIKDHRGNQQKLPSLLKQYPIYSILSSMEKDDIKKLYDSIYARCCKIIKETQCVTIGCLIDIEKLSYLYGETVTHNTNLLFDIAIQEIISNYAHFLLHNNGVGNIIYESRNDSAALTEKSSDYKMFDNFCKIKSCNKGILFADEKMIAKTIRYFYMHNKQENIAGLQFADFIAYNFIHGEKISNVSQKTEFMNKITERLYNGMHDISIKDLRQYFGLKKIPFDFEKMQELQNEYSKIKKTYENLKIERNSLIKKIKKISESKEKLIDENIKLKKPLILLFNSFIIYADTMIIS